SWAVWVPAALGLLGVGLGAFGAHGLKPLLAERGMLEVWQTAVFYHLLHAVAGLWAAERERAALWLWAAGVVVFSGSLYAMALSGQRWLGAVTPLGGVLLLAGWAACLLAARRRS
ncbi:MAG: DUF423 domain-containing protein, partial [Terrimicrobiaceae bacterium]|nr:DUF423 domain-containing protein [Terrimicrobiaceae bacterium]